MTSLLSTLIPQATLPSFWPTLGQDHSTAHSVRRAKAKAAAFANQREVGKRARGAIRRAETEKRRAAIIAALKSAGQDGATRGQIIEGSGVNVGSTAHHLKSLIKSGQVTYSRTDRTFTWSQP